MTAEPSPGLTAALAAKAATLSFGGLPAPVVELVRQCLLDYLAVSLAGADDPLVAILLEEEREAAGAPHAGVIGQRDRLPALAAALVNGAAAHALDYDDVNMTIPGHPTAALFAALLAQAEAGERVSGPALITAFVAGYEAACRIGAAVQPGHYALGFHPTGTVVGFGVAAGCGRLLGLDAAAIAQAVGIAGSQAAGLKAQFGSMCKPFHAGRAAQAGLLAARLARRGFTSHPALLECAQGFGATYGPDFAPAAALAEPPGGFHLHANLFKFHASGYLTHAPIECARQLRAQHGVTAEAVTAITLRLDRGADRVCNIPDPTTGRECKFSLKQATAMALAGIDTASNAAYSLEAARDPELARLRHAIGFEFQDGWSATRAEMMLTLADGRRLDAAHDAGVPATDLADQAARLRAKFVALVEPVLGASRMAALLARIDDLANLSDVGELMRLTAPA